METRVLSVGGSIVVPEKLDWRYLKELKGMLLSTAFRFIIVVGGGRTAREYISAGRELGFSDEENDWIGIHTTRLNARFLQTLFMECSPGEIITDPTKKIPFEKRILFAGGYRPGNSTDLVSVLLAKSFGEKRVINITNIDFIYDKDPRKYPDASPFIEIKSEDYLDIIGRDWQAGKSTPFDPIATKAAKDGGISVSIVSSRDISNLRSAIEGKKFRGTTIIP